MQIRHFPGVAAVDLAELHALNRACLRLMRGVEGGPCRAQLPAALGAQLEALTDWQIERLARVPVLLGMSTAQADYWDAWFDRDVQTALFRDSGTMTPVTEVAVATLVFLWQLVRANAYTARLISGASVNWCERLAECRLAWLVRRVRVHPDFLLPRQSANASFWTRLLNDGVSPERSVRTAAHLCAMQTVLTVPEAVAVDRFRSVACAQRVPTLKVAESNSS